MNKIMFNDKYGLNKAVLEGIKTQTRRLIPIDTYNCIDWKAFEKGDMRCAWDGNDNWQDIRVCGRYCVGEEVAIAQCYADILAEYCKQGKNDGVIKSMCEGAGRNNKMFVKARLMPHRIRITNVRIERLQDISDEDCLKEGIIEDCKNIQYSYPTNIGYCGQFPFDTPKAAFASLIDKTSGKGTWEDNPWVFVYDFELIK